MLYFSLMAILCVGYYSVHSFMINNSTHTISIPNKKLDQSQNEYIKTLIAVSELSKFRPSIENADEIIERVFLMSLNTTKSEMALTTNLTTNSTANSTSEASLVLSETKTNYSIANASTNVTAARTSTTALLPTLEVHGNLQPILESKRFHVSKDKRRYLRRRCGGISWDSINEIASKTVNQFDDPIYMVLRKYRLTASSFGSILQAIRRNSYPPSLYKKLMGDYNLEKVLAIRWGKFHESSALETLRQLHPSWNITRAGLYLHKSGLLGASPDAITDECVIEIKCPYRFRKEKNLELSLLPETRYIIIRAADGTYYVNPNHVYYDQVQAEILFSGRQYGVLFIWTPNEAKLFRIEKDESWAKKIDLILKFYMTKFVPYVLDLQHNNETEVKKIKMLTV